MYYFTIFIISLFFLHVQDTSKKENQILNHSQKQAKYYFSQSEEEENAAAYFWGLYALSNQQPEIQRYVSSLRASKKNLLPGQELFQPAFFNASPLDQLKKLTFASGSEDLLVLLILKDQDHDEQLRLKEKFIRTFGVLDKSPVSYASIIDHIINKKPITENILPVESFRVLHFFLIFNKTISGNVIIPRDYLQKASDRWTNIRDRSDTPLEQSMREASRACLYYLLDKYSDLKDLAPEILADTVFPNSPERLSLFRLLDYSLYRLGYYDESLKISRNFSVPLAQYLKDRQTELSILISQAAYLLKIGKISEAQKLNKEILKKSVQYGKTISKSSIYNNLSFSYFKMGNFDKYLQYQLKALQIAKDQQNYSHQLQVLRNLYVFEKINKNKNSALLYLNKAKMIAKNQNDLENLGKIYVSYGSYYRDAESDYLLAGSYYQKADSILDQKKYYDTYLTLQFEKAALKKDLGQKKDAITIYQKIEELADIKEDKSNYLDAYIRETELLLDLHSSDELTDRIDKIKETDLSQLNFMVIVKAKTVEADYYIQSGNLPRAYQILHSTISRIVDWAQNSTDIQSGYWNIEPEYLHAFQLMADLLINTDRPGAAVEVLDKLKTINDAALYQNPMVKSSLLNEAELTQYQQLSNQLDYLRKQQLIATGQTQLELRTQIDQLSAKKRILDRKITSLADRNPVEVDKIQQQLDAHQVVLHITELDNNYYISTISHTDIKFKKVKLDSTLRHLFTNAVKTLADGKTDLTQLYKISRLLDIQELPDWINQITIIPDSYLYQLPIDVLPLTRPDHSYSYGDTRYLIERFDTHYLTSLGDFFNNPEKQKQNYKWDFVGYGVSKFENYKKKLIPLPYATTEVKNILAKLTNLDHKNELLNASATEQAFKKTASKARILHLATHSQVSDRDPLFSTIYLSPEADKKDQFAGQVFAYELFELNLSNDLIMLNSCESGSGSYLQGAGVMGFSRALRYAGASSLILNLWSVNDMMASEFASRFYESLNQGKSKAEALRSAKLYFLKNKNADPHYWGTYMLIGNNDPVIKPFKLTNIYLASTFMLYFVTLVAFGLFNKKNT